MESNYIACTLCALDRNETVMAVETAWLTHPSGAQIYFSICEQCAETLARGLSAPFN
jgi:hypothetical protein